MAVLCGKKEEKETTKERGEGEGGNTLSVTQRERQTFAPTTSGYSQTSTLSPTTSRTRTDVALFFFSSSFSSSSTDGERRFRLNSTADCCSPSTDTGGFYSRPRVTDVARDGVKSWRLVVSREG